MSSQSLALSIKQYILNRLFYKNFKNKIQFWINLNSILFQYLDFDNKEAIKNNAICEKNLLHIIISPTSVINNIKIIQNNHKIIIKDFIKHHALKFLKYNMERQIFSIIYRPFTNYSTDPHLKTHLTNHIKIQKDINTEISDNSTNISDKIEKHQLAAIQAQQTMRTHLFNLLQIEKYDEYIFKKRISNNLCKYILRVRELYKKLVTIFNIANVHKIGHLIIEYGSAFEKDDFTNKLISYYLHIIPFNNFDPLANMMVCNIQRIPVSHRYITKPLDIVLTHIENQKKFIARFNLMNLKGFHRMRESDCDYKLLVDRSHIELKQTNNQLLKNAAEKVQKTAQQKLEFMKKVKRRKVVHLLKYLD